MRYIIDRSTLVSSGGTSKLYRCQDAIGIRGVCKVLPKTPSMLNKFKNEVECLRELSFSPKVVQLYDAVDAEDEYIMVMEWCRGGAVRDYANIHGDLYSVNTVASILRGVLRGLVHVHSRNIVHLDIKPGNVLFTDTSEGAEVKLADFGSAVNLDKPSERNSNEKENSNANVNVNTIVGTPWYMSPELLRSVITPKCDVWSVGIMAYQLLTGYMPFDDADKRVPQIWRKILLKEPQWDGQRWDSIPEEAREFVKLCLEKEPDARPTAIECLEHGWLLKTGCDDRFTGTPLVVPLRECESSFMHAKTWIV